MPGSAAWKHGSWRWLACSVMVACVGPRDGLAQEASRVRPMDEKAAELLQAGKMRSQTFRRLVERLDRSDLIVWVAAGHISQAGHLQFVAAAPHARYVRVAVRFPGLENDLLSILAHELQHAVEVAGSPEVRDATSLKRLYQRIGRVRPAGSGSEMETAEAQRAGTAVLNELLDAPYLRHGAAAKAHAGAGKREW